MGCYDVVLLCWLLAHPLHPSPPLCLPATGQELLRITAASHSGASLCVWALLVTGDGTIVSGDSEGAVQFWDGSNGTLLTRLQRHAADVLALAEWRGSVWAAGVDPRVSLGSSGD